jgi:hypothetical protein
VDKGFVQQAVPDGNHFIFNQGNIFGTKDIVSPSFEFIPPDIAFINGGSSHKAFAQEITAGNIGVFKMEIDGVAGSNPVKCIKLEHLIVIKGIFDKGFRIKTKFIQIHVHPADDSVIESF